MFGNEIAINEFLLTQFSNTAKDIDESTLFQRGAGHGHPPIWILGHLAVTGEMGHPPLGGAMTHGEWAKLFGPGSSDSIPEDCGLTKDELCAATVEAYRGLRELAAQADAGLMAKPHGLGLFEGTPIQSMGHLISVLLTNHFGFHLAQLSSCRREAGHPHLF